MGTFIAYAKPYLDRYDLAGEVGGFRRGGKTVVSPAERGDGYDQGNFRQDFVVDVFASFVALK